MRASLLTATLPCWAGITSWCQPLASQPSTSSRKADRIASQPHWDELEWSAMLSSAAYAGCTGKTHDVTITHQIADRATATQGYIGVSDQRKRIVVVFRGSDQAADYRNDVDVRKEPITGLNGTSFPAGVEVMRGIHRPWSAVHNDVIIQLKDLTTKYPNYALGITGHSLGGSITYLAFPVLSQIFPSKQIIASPLNAFPIGNEAFTNMTTKLLSQTRVVRRGTEHGDGVPNMYALPPTRLLPQLFHYGTEFYTNGTLKTTLTCSGQRDMSCSAGNGAMGPNPNHHWSFGVDMGPSGAMGCMASGGDWGANGGVMYKKIVDENGVVMGSEIAEGPKGKKMKRKWKV